MLEAVDNVIEVLVRRHIDIERVTGDRDMHFRAVFDPDRLNQRFDLSSRVRRVNPQDAINIKVFRLSNQRQTSSPCDEGCLEINQITEGIVKNLG